jgi:hypothetical protein
MVRGAGVALAVIIAVLGYAGSASASPPVTFPDGLVVRLVAVEVMPAADAATCSPSGVCGPGQAPGDRLVRITLGLALPPDAPGSIPLDVVAGTASGIALTAAGRTLPIDCGNMAETTVLCTDNSASVPAAVMPGREVLLSEAYDVPVGDLSALTVTFQPPVNAGGINPLTPVTFAATAQ